MRFWHWVCSTGWGRNFICFCKWNIYCKESCCLLTDADTHSWLSGKLTVIIINWKWLFSAEIHLLSLYLNSLHCSRSVLFEKCCVWSLTVTWLWIVNSIRGWNIHLVSVQVSAGDGLPGPVCCQCAKLVSTGYSFKLQVEKTDMLLRGYVSSHCEEDGCIKCQA